MEQDVGLRQNVRSNAASPARRRRLALNGRLHVGLTLLAIFMIGSFIAGLLAKFARTAMQRTHLNATLVTFAGNLIYYACMLWADIWLALVLIIHRNFHLEEMKKDQSYIFVCNHISYLDSALVPKMFRRPVRPLGKIEMSRVPIFGFIYKNVIVTVDRSSPENRVKSVMILKSILKKRDISACLS